MLDSLQETGYHGSYRLRSDTASWNTFADERFFREKIIVKENSEMAEREVFDINHLNRTYLKLALPVASGMVVTLLYNLADTWFIAQTGNKELVAGVALCAPVFTTLMAFGNIYGQGGSSLISRMIGKGDGQGARRASAFCFYIAIATGLILGALMFGFRIPLLRLAGTSQNTFSYADSYFRVMAVGAPFVVLNFIHLNLVRCEGMAAQSMIGSILGSVVNIILDPVLIFGLKMGASGAAAATVTGYLCSDLFFLILVLRKSRNLSIRPSDCHIGRWELGQIIGVGVSAALTNLMQSLSVVILNHSLLPYGDDRIAAMGIVLRVNMIAQLILIGLTFGGVPLFGYLYGAKKYAETKRLIRFCLSFLGALALGLTVLLLICAQPLIRVFMKDPVIVSEGTRMLRWLATGTVFFTISLLFTILFQAAGRIISALLMSVSRQGFLFAAAIAVGTALFGYTGVLCAQPAADVLSVVLALVLYRRMICSVNNKPQKG